MLGLFSSLQEDDNIMLSYNYLKVDVGTVILTADVKKDVA